MYIKLEQKDMPYKPQIYQKGRGENWRQFDGRNNWRGYRPYYRNHNNGNRGMDVVEVVLGEVILEEDIITEVDIIMIEE